MSKIIKILLSCIIILSLAACTPAQEDNDSDDLGISAEDPANESEEPADSHDDEDPADESDPPFDPYADEEEMTGEEEDFPWEDEPVPEFSNTHDETIVAALTPDGAYIHADIESMLVLETNMSMNEMIEFILNAVEELGVTHVSTDESRSGFWTYDGTLENDIHLHIELRDDGGSVNMMVLY